MVRRNRSVRTTRKKRQYGGARTKGVPRKYVPMPSRFPMQAANAAAAALQQVQENSPEIQNQTGMKQKRRVTEKKLAANQRRRNISQKFKSRNIKQNPNRLREYKERSAAGEANNAILAQWMKPAAPAVPAAANMPYNDNNNAISELSNYDVNTNEYERLLQEARNAPNVIENENSNREPMSADAAAAAALAAVRPSPPGGPVTVPFPGKTAKIQKINKLRGRVPKTAKAPNAVSRPRGRPRKTPVVAGPIAAPSVAIPPTPVEPTTTSTFGQVVEQPSGHVEAGKKAVTSAKGSAWLQEIKEARNLLNKVLQEHGMKTGITQADARTYASLRRKDPVAAQQFTQTVVTNASKAHNESKWSE